MVFTTLRPPGRNKKIWLRFDLLGRKYFNYGKFKLSMLSDGFRKVWKEKKKRYEIMVFATPQPPDRNSKIWLRYDLQERKYFKCVKFQHSISPNGFRKVVEREKLHEIMVFATAP